MTIPKGAEPGTRYGPLVVSEVLTRGPKARVRFQCDCGGFHDAQLRKVRTSVKRGALSGCKSCQSKANSERQLNKFDASLYMQKRFGRLLVTGVVIDSQRKNHKTHLVCLCDCGAQAVVAPKSLVDGNTKSCGCLSREKAAELFRELSFIHGNTVNGELNGATSIYTSWLKVRRCCHIGKQNAFNRVNHEYDPRWDDFRNFYADFGPIGRYQTISRINKKLPWSKDNCFVNVGQRHLLEKRMPT